MHRNGRYFTGSGWAAVGNDTRHFAPNNRPAGAGFVALVVEVFAYHRDGRQKRRGVEATTTTGYSDPVARSETAAASGCTQEGATR